MSPRLRSSKPAEEGLGPEIQQHDGIRRVEFPLAHEHNSKQGIQAKEEMIGEMYE
jgi:hypothetical protein